MNFDPFLPQERIAAMRAEGRWHGRIVTDYMDDAVANVPDQVAVTDINSTTGRNTTLSYRQLRRISDRMALGLVKLGVEPGDVVSAQLPNWWQMGALYLACVRIGAVMNPLMPIFRQRELKYMLNFCEAKVFVIPRRFRGFDYPRMVAEIRGELPQLEQVLVVDGEDEASSFEALLLDRRWEDEMDGLAIFTERRPSADDVTELIYTSGTTGQPKGVMHTAHTMFGNVEVQITQIGINRGDVVLMASPLAHQTGFLYGMVLPILLQSKSVLQDVWDPVVAAQRIEEERANITVASTPFLADLTHNPGVERHDTSALRIFICGGAPIPRVLMREATEKLGFRVVTVWGMTENGIVTCTRDGDPPEKVFDTDGVAVPGAEVRIVDDSERVLGAHEDGHLQARGASNFVGYLKRPELNGFSDDGWFTTGDIARMDDDGYIRITGRAKDIIIRGGENIPVVEVEELLYRHPDVEDAAVVGMPDERLGERGCAFIVLKEGKSMSFQDMVEYLQGAKLSRTYLPERLELLAEMPRTPSGKIQKFKLRDAVAELSPAG